jgi:uncharacterized glyoxalase superfamily protein PhnB
MLKAINLLGFYVKDTANSVSFYKQLGFEVVHNDGLSAEVRLVDTRLQFVAQATATNMSASFQKDAFGEPKGLGVYVNIEVTDIDTYYQNLLNEGMAPSTKPRDWSWGHREFVLRDPDQYKLVFYQKLKIDA